MFHVKVNLEGNPDPLLCAREFNLKWEPGLVEIYGVCARELFQKAARNISHSKEILHFSTSQGLKAKQ